MRQPFSGNIIPANRIDPVAAKILATIPRPNIANTLVNNYQPGSPFRKIQQIPSLKIDHNITQSEKISGYWSQEITEKDVGQDGLPDPISIRRDLYIKGKTVRINYDQSLRPTLLLPDATGPSRATVRGGWLRTLYSRDRING